MAEYYNNHKDELMPVNRIRNRNWYKTVGRARNQKPEWRFAIYVSAAKRSGRRFDLTRDEFMSFVGIPCYYCGSDVDPIGLDRVNNDIGYIKDNIVSCCQLCNFMKRSMFVDDFVKQCVKISKKCGIL